MISLDDKPSGKRFAFNRPYDFIKFVNLRTTDFFEAHKFRNQLLIWLDYDSSLFEFRGTQGGTANDDILTDIRTILMRAMNETFFIITLDVTCPQDVEIQRRFRAEFDEFLPSKYKANRYITSQGYLSGTTLT